MTSLAARLEEMLAGLPEEYRAASDMPFEVPPVQCDVCQDTGWVRYAVPVGHPKFGKMFPCPERNCEAGMRRQRERVERVISRSTWSPEYDRWTYDTFQHFSIAGKQGALIASMYFGRVAGAAFDLNTAAREFFGMDWPELQDTREKSSVMLTGEHGLGKTGLAVATANALRAQGVPVLFLRVKEMVIEVQSAYDVDEKQSAKDKIQFFASVPVLILDEFELENYSRDRREIIEQVMRQRDRDNLPFMATTNLSLDGFYKAWGGKIADIVAKAHWVAIQGEKLRITSRRVEVF